jgi:3-oxoacyl-[acyl-carrier protein] reductase
MPKLHGKCALITGASRGIGAGIARVLAADGAKIIINYRGNRDAAETTVAAIRAAGGWAEAMQADVANVAGTKALVAAAAARFAELGQRLDIFIANAGVCTPNPLDKLDEAEFDHQFNTNVKAVLFGAQAAASSFGNAGGVILVIGSLNGRQPAAGAAIYSATKAAVAAITVSLAQELGPRNIRINTLAPGLTHSDLVDNFYKPEDFEKVAEMTALRRIGEPEDIGKAAAFLVSDDAGWITGEIITASGGLFG